MVTRSTSKKYAKHWKVSTKIARKDLKNEKRLGHLEKKVKRKAYKRSKK